MGKMDKNMDISTHTNMSESGETSGLSLGKGSGSDGLLDWEALKAATKCLKSVAHPVRLRMLELLTGGEYTVGELAELCEVEQATASEHLGRLRDRGILSYERRGRQVYYEISARAVDGIVHCMRSNFGPEARPSDPACGH
jgi:DNA-binding transcriptional ArsR family regulator